MRLVLTWSIHLSFIFQHWPVTFHYLCLSSYHHSPLACPYLRASTLLSRSPLFISPTEGSSKMPQVDYHALILGNMHENRNPFKGNYIIIQCTLYRDIGTFKQYTIMNERVISFFRVFHALQMVASFVFYQKI